MKVSDLLTEYFSDFELGKESAKNKVLSESTLPISPYTCGWEIHQTPERFSKKFTFLSKASLKDFVVECLDYEKDSMHSGQHRIDDLSVTVEVYTHDVDRITELDQEYIKNVDFIYRDVLDFVNK